MISTKALYVTTLLATSLAGFSTGWAARPVEKVVLSERERFLHEWTVNYDVSSADRERLEAVLDRYFAELDGLRAEFDRKYGDRIGDLRDRYDREIQSILVPDKRK